MALPKPIIDANFTNTSPVETPVRRQIRKLTKQLETLETILKGSNTVGIKGLSHCQYSNMDWEIRVHTLLTDARVPLSWFYDIIPAETKPTDNDIDAVTIYFINETVKNTSILRLKLLLQKKHPNIKLLI